jgi:hypothetical protein
VAGTTRPPRTFLKVERVIRGIRQGLSLTGALCVALGVLVGLCAGLSVAAGVLAVAGRALLDIPVARAQVFLVVGPLLGFLPLAAYFLAATQYDDLARFVPVTMGLWLLSAGAAGLWFGLLPLLS